MSNEEKILSMLTKLQSDIADIKQHTIESENEKPAPKKKKLTQREVFMGFANLLDEDERDALGKYMAAEEARKAALYG
jgi:hypothetical protein